MRRPTALLAPLAVLWRSVAFRLALIYTLLSAATVLVLLTVVYMQTVGALQQATNRQVTLMLQHLESQFALGGRDAVVSAIAQALTDGRDSENEIYLLQDENGRTLAGNIDAVPAELVPGQPPEEHAVRRAGYGAAAYGAAGQLLLRALPDGATLVVGRDVGDEHRMESMVGQASQAAGLMALLMVVAGSYFFRMTLDEKVSAMRRTLARVGSGGIAQRQGSAAPDTRAHAADDEFGRLNADINQMLDRMELLIDGVRHVSNTIAHNLRTPLTRILARLRAAQGEAVPAQQRQDTIEATLAELENLNIVFEKLLQIAEAESGAGRQNFTTVRLDLLVADVVDLYAALAEEQGVQLTLATPGDAVAVAGDPDLLAGAVANLVDNALKYASAMDGAEVTLHIGRRGTQAVLTVADNGPGIPPQDRPHVGTRFYRRDPALPGYGLGLSSVFAVVGLHGGSHSLADASPGSARPGLAVRITLPLKTG